LGEDPGEAQILTLPDAKALSPEQLSRVLQHRKQIEKWLKSCGALALTQPPPGWKVVEGSSKRNWALDAEGVVEALRMEDVDPAPYTRTALVGITEAEKALKKVRPDLIDTLFVKPPGKPSVAPASDKRPALDPLSALPDEDEDE
jgi:hypothetical protein